jgi:hypothetical protein
MSLCLMINPFDETPAEKEDCIIDSLERGYSYSQIMKQCHVSPVTISSVKKKIFGITDNHGLQTGNISKESQAFRLFQQGRSLVDVKTEVDIDSDDVVEYHRRYQELSGADMFNKGYDKVKGNIKPFLQIFDLMNALGLTPEQVQEQVRYGYELPNLQNIHTKMNSEIQDMAAKHYYLDCQLASAAKELQEYKNSLQFYDSQCVQKRNEIRRLDYGINRKKRFNKRLNSGAEHKGPRKFANREEE